MHKVLSLLILLLLSGCKDWKEVGVYTDSLFFEWGGVTFFSKASQLSTKELHLEAGRLLGRDVILEGDIILVGKYYTHLVVSDGFGRMLVVLTQLEGVEDLLKGGSVKRIKVLGVLERGKKGLPYILARSINPAFKDEKEISENK